MSNAPLDTFTRAYIEAALWSTSIGEGHDCPDDTSLESAGYTIDDIADIAISSIVDDCATFQLDNAVKLGQAGTDEQNGHDFWLTRNGHGAGFWDRGYVHEIGQGLTDAAHNEASSDWYIGDDGKVYVL